MKTKALLVGLAVVLVVAVAAVVLDPTHVLRGRLTGELFYRGRPVSYWRQALQTKEPTVEAETHRSLKEGGPSAVPVLVALLSETTSSSWDTSTVRRKAAGMLGEIGPEARDGVGALTEALKDDDPHVRTVAAKSLEVVAGREAAADVVPSLIPLVTPGEPAAADAARALSRFGPEARAAVPALVQALKDKDGRVRWEAARTLGKMRAAAKEAVPALVAAMKDEDPLVREHAAEALGDIGPEAKEGVPGLTEALKDPVARVRRDAARSLGNIGPAARPALPTLQEMVNDEDKNVRDAVARAVRILSAGAKKEAP